MPQKRVYDGPASLTHPQLEGIMPRLACLCFLFVSAAAGAAHAQGLYLQNQQSGIGVAAGLSHNDDALGLSLGGGYSYKAFIDAGLFVNRYGYSTDEANVSSIGVQPYVNVHLLRQSDTVPVALAAVGNFQKYFYSATDDRDIDGYSFFLGGSAYRRFGLSETVSVSPQATLGYNFAHTSGGVGLFKTSRDDGSLLLQLAGNFAYQAGGPIWTLNPLMAIDSTYVTFGLIVGATFALGH
jgi:hypothetical protein